MDDEELCTLLADTESDRSERTVSLDKTDKFGEAICAFANDLPCHGKPGYLFVGADPSGRAAGADISSIDCSRAWRGFGRTETCCRHP